MILDENGNPNTYWLEWKEGRHQTDYNNCRFSEDKLEFAKNWLLTKKPNVDWINPKNVVDIIAKQKLRFITDEDYCNKAQLFADKCTVRTELPSEIKENMLVDCKIFSTDIENNIKHWYDCFKSKTSDWRHVWFKTNHGSGWNLNVDFLKMPTAPKYIAYKLEEWMSLNYAYISGYEKQYEKIVPKVIMEPHLVDQPIDYGFWCINGNIEGISLTKKLGKNLEAYLAFVNEQSKENDWYIGCKSSMTDLPLSWKKRIDEVIPYIKELAKPWDFVRVDFNYVNGKWYFREMTFTPCSGILDIGYNKL